MTTSSPYAALGAPVTGAARTGPVVVRVPARSGRDAPVRSGGRTRLTRRGRVLVVLAVAGLLLAAFSLGRVDSQAAVPGSGASDQGARPALTQTVVLPGETLWSIARDLAPDNDPREVVAQIRELNDLSGGLVAGQQLLLPAVSAG
jgi:hypothetical protein